MTFEVEPEAVRHYGFMISRARDDAQDCKDYFTAHVPEVTMGIEGGLFNPIGYAHTGVRRRLGEMLDQMVSVLDASHKALFEAAKHYENTDDSSAARLDRSYPAAQRPIPDVS